MVPMTKDELRTMITEITVGMYEELTPQLITRIDQTKKNPDLTEAQKQDELLLDFMGYIKSCTNEIMIETLARILGL